MNETTLTPLAQLAKAYVSEKLHLDPRAGGEIADEIWIRLAESLLVGQVRAIEPYRPVWLR